MTSGVQAPSANSTSRLLPAFGAAIFLSAALLFAVQPMFTKMVLPRFGGAPSVWSVAMVFFQATLLAGYAYAHALTKLVPLRGAIAVQLALMAAAAAALPLSIASGWGRPPETGEAFWLIGLFTASIGLPFFALSANGPLLQAWFARSDHPAAGNPYFLYAASNIGSFLALISYPAVIEPLLPLGDQTRGWSAGFALLIALIAICGAMLWRGAKQPVLTAALDGPAPTLRDALAWMALAAVPSGLLVAVTAHISTDIAAVPLLWVLPLALYLLTFVIVFSTRPVIPHRLAVAAQPFIVAVLVAVLVLDIPGSIFSLVVLDLLAFFAAALVCHGELARRRPAPRHLTAFYMWMSAGGMIGGLATGLIAPVAFNWVAEYPILIVLALLCRPGVALPRGRERLAWIGAIILATVALLLLNDATEQLDGTLAKIAVAALLAVALVVWRRPLALALIVAFLLLASLADSNDPDSEWLRSFFGVHKIAASNDEKFRVLMHGTTIHGAERVADIKDDDDDEEEDAKPSAEPEAEGERPIPLTYYFDGSPLAQTIVAARERAGGKARVAVVGLGSGTLACQTRPGDTLTYYEIDPTVVRIAHDRDRFTFLTSCAPDARIMLGDARLTLGDAADGSYDIIIVDAFSSDSIPIHLLTREAMALYARKVAPAGMVVLHLSNRNLELASVAAGIAAANGLVSRRNDTENDGVNEDQYRFASNVVAIARRDEDFGTLTQSKYWERQMPDPHQWVWTDDYSNVAGAVWRKYRPE